MNFLLTTILPAITPALADGVRGIFSRLTKAAGGMPQNVNERIQLMQAETERIKALAEIDKPIGNPSQWVVDVRAIFRYATVSGIWVITGLSFLLDAPLPALLVLLDIASATTTFIIGERLYLKLKD